MTYFSTLRDFLSKLQSTDALKIISAPVSPHLEMTELCYRSLQAHGPALYFENPENYSIPVLGNLFGSEERVLLALGLKNNTELREFGKMLASLHNPEPVQALSSFLQNVPQYKNVIHTTPKKITEALCQEIIIEKEDVDLYQLPIQHCWPEDAGRLITWGLVITKGPHQERHNVAIYRQQVIEKNKVIMRWLAHRGGAMDFLEWKQKYPGQKFPVAVAIGADPYTLLAAVTPIPNHLSEYSFAGLLRGARTEIVQCKTHDLYVPASAEIVLEGYIDPTEMALEGPFGDHTGYYNAQDYFPVFTIEKISHRKNPLYHSTYMGKPPDEPAIMASVLNEIFIPLLQKQFPEIIDFYLPPEGCSYRFAIVTIKKKYPAHAKRIMMGIWSYLTQFTYTKFVVVLDDDIDARNWKEVIWAITTRMDPARDTVLLENTPIDYLDFASPTIHLGGKIGWDATNKWPSETKRAWGKPIQRDPEVQKNMEKIWNAVKMS